VTRSRSARSFVDAVLLSTALLVARPAHAEPQAQPPGSEAARVVVIVPAGDDSLARRIQAELGAIGFEVVQVPEGRAGAPGERAPLEALARRMGAIAAVRFVPSRTGVEVWVVDRVTGKTSLREVSLPSTDDPRSVDVIAIRAVELLRASLIEIEAAQPRQGDVEPPPVVARVVERTLPARKPAPPELARFGVEIGPAVTASLGGIGPALQTFVRLGYSFDPGFSVGVLAFAPTFAPSLCAEAGCAAVYPIVAGLDARFELGGGEPGWQPGAGLSLLVVALRMAGDADAPYEDRSVTIASAAAALHGDLGYRFSSRVGVRASLFVGATAQRMEMSFAGERVGHWGRPLFAGSLALDVRF
jgi:hypothetical protein